MVPSESCHSYTQSCQPSLILFQRRTNKQKNKGRGPHGSYRITWLPTQTPQWLPVALRKTQRPATPMPAPISASLSLYHLIPALCSGHPGTPSASGMWPTRSPKCLESFSHPQLTPLQFSNPSWCQFFREGFPYIPLLVWVQIYFPCCTFSWNPASFPFNTHLCWDYTTSSWCIWLMSAQEQKPHQFLLITTSQCPAQGLPHERTNEWMTTESLAMGKTWSPSKTPKDPAILQPGRNVYICSPKGMYKKCSWPHDS